MKCDYFQKNLCRSCSLLESTYAQTLVLKQEQLRSLFPNDKLKILPSIGIDADVSGTRSKVKLAVFSQNEKITFGVVDSHLNPTELENCPLHSNGLNDLLPILKQLLIQYAILPYNLQSKQGELKFIILSKSEETNQIMLRLVLRSKESLDRLKKLVQDLGLKCPNIVVVTANIQPDHKAVIEGELEIVLSHEKMIVHQFGEIKLALGARSFFQVTPVIAKKLYSAVEDDLREQPVDTLLDLFCGVGAFAFYAHKHVKQVTGVELSPEAIECAKFSNTLNGTAIDFIAEDAFTYLSKRSGQYEGIIVNPPRRGLGDEINNLLIGLNPKVIYYSSCNAQTLARDAETLTKNYQLSSLQLFDMFPYTTHFETLAIFRRKIT